MEITDHFVFLHFPKTGGTFVTKNLKSLYAGGHEKQAYSVSPSGFYRRDVLITHPEHGKLLTHKNKHGTRSQIPFGHRKKTIAITMRNPFDWYVSQYFFGWWKRVEYENFYARTAAGSRGQLNPADIQFPDFIRFIDKSFPSHRNVRLNSTHALGYMTRQFLHYSLKNPRQAKLDRFSEREEIVEFVLREIKDVHFLRQENLNMDLYKYLARWGYEELLLRAIPEAEKVLPAGSNRTNHDWRVYYSKELVEEVVERDWLLLRLFPEYKQSLTAFEGISKATQLEYLSRDT